MISLLYWLVFIGFTVLGYYRFKWAMTCYLAFKIVLIKPMLLVYLSGFPLLTLDRALELVLLILFPLQFKNLKNSLLQFRQNLFFIPWMVLLGLHIILWIWNLNNWVISTKGLALFVFEYLALFFIIINTLQTRKELFDTVKWIAIVFLGVGIYGMFNKLSGANPFIDFYATQAQQIGNDSLVFTYIPKDRFGIVGRIQSVVFHPIAYGGILAMVLPAFAIEFVRNQKLSIKWSWYLLTLLLGFNLVFANSRAAIISCVIISIGVIYVFFKRYRNKINSLFISIPMVLVMVFFGLFFEEIILRFGEAFQVFKTPDNLVGSTLPDRIVKFKYAWETISNNYLFGLGFGTVADFIKQENSSLGGAESFWIKQLIEAGFVGVIAYFVFFTVSAINVFRQSRELKSVELIYLFTLILGYFVFVSLTGELGTFPMFVILLALYSNLATAQTKADV